MKHKCTPQQLEFRKSVHIIIQSGLYDPGEFPFLGFIASAARAFEEKSFQHTELIDIKYDASYVMKMSKRAMKTVRPTQVEMKLIEDGVLTSVEVSRGQVNCKFYASDIIRKARSITSIISEISEMPDL